MDAVGNTAAWLSFAVTAIGLGSLITQANGIQDRLDPYRTSRSAEYLGAWIARQPKKSLFRLAQPAPVGPVVHAKLVDGFCGSNVIGLSRLPLEKTGQASWTGLLAVLHEDSTPIASNSDNTGVRTNPSVPMSKREHSATNAFDLDVERGSFSRRKRSWTTLQARPLTRHHSTIAISISRTTLITILALCHSRPIFRYSDASGHRASYASYCGYFYIEWPLGAPAVLTFHPHDSHSISTDVYPLMFRVRVDKSVQMMAGVITSADNNSFQCAFAGRKPPGKWTIEYQCKGFSGAHGTRHLYNLMGGRVYEVDFLHARRSNEEDPSDALELHLPSTEEHIQLSMFVPNLEQGVLEHALDCLPWSSLSWSVHRGLQDILVAYAKPTMEKCRQALAFRLRKLIDEQPYQLEAKGWSSEFTMCSMAELAFNAVSAASGNSGDSVRVVTDAAAFLSGKDPMELDDVNFWRVKRHTLNKDASLSTNAIVALTKCFVLEWSINFDYRMYQELLPELLFR